MALDLHPSKAVASNHPTKISTSAREPTRCGHGMRLGAGVRRRVCARACACGDGSFTHTLIHTLLLSPLSYVLRLVPMELLALHLSQRSPSTREQRWRLSEPLAQPRRAGLQQAASEMLGGALLRLGLRPRRVRRRALCEPAEQVEQRGRQPACRVRRQLRPRRPRLGRPGQGPGRTLLCASRASRARTASAAANRRWRWRR